MFGFIVFLHVIVSVALVAIILMQSGRGGGLTEAFSSAESMFGAKTNEFLIRGTTVLAVIFLVTSLSLAFISSKKGKSLMSNKVVAEEQQAAKEATPTETAPAKAASAATQTATTPEEAAQ